MTRRGVDTAREGDGSNHLAAILQALDDLANYHGNGIALMEEIETQAREMADEYAAAECQRDVLLDALRYVADIYPLDDLKRVHAVLAAYDDPDALDERLIVHNPKPRWT